MGELCWVSTKVNHASTHAGRWVPLSLPGTSLHQRNRGFEIEPELKLDRERSGKVCPLAEPPHPAGGWGWHAVAPSHRTRLGPLFAVTSREKSDEGKRLWELGLLTQPEPEGDVSNIAPDIFRP